LDEFSVIQLPTRRMLGSIGIKAEAPAPPTPPTSTAKDTELARLNQWLKELESRASTADERADHAETELEELRPKLETERLTLAGLKTQHEKEVSGLRAELSALRTQATNLRGEATNLRGEATGLRAEGTGLRAEISNLRAETSSLRGEATDLRAESSHNLSELARLKAELAARDQQLAEQAAKSDQGEELAEFERQLVERGGELRRLEQDLRISERTGRELVRELARRSGEQATQGSAELERALAEREADLQAAAWTIESLSLRLELAGKSPLAPTRGDAEGQSSESALPNEEAR
jgi:chromosome segregation ATPase